MRLVVLLAVAGSAAAVNMTCAELGCGTRNASQPCACNSACSRYRDCCADFNTTCAGHMPTPEPRAPTPPPAPADDDAPLPPPSGGAPEQIHLALTKATDEMRVSFTTMGGAGAAAAGAAGGTPARAVAATATTAAGGGAAAHSPPAVASVRYGTSAAVLDRVATGGSSTYRDGGWRGVLHTVLLRGLAPGTRYYYRPAYAGADAPGVSSFVSAAAVGAVGGGAAATRPLVVAVVADLGSNCVDKRTWREPGCGNGTIAALTAGAAALPGTPAAFDLLLHAGDIAYTSGAQGIWDVFLRQMEPVASRVPYMVCAGNHEHYFNFSGFRHRFDMPGPGAPREGVVSVAAAGATGGASGAGAGAGGDHGAHNLWHSFDAGGAHFVGFSSEHNLTVGSPQHAWLDADLAAARAGGATWLVAYGHRPLYCTCSDSYDCGAGEGYGAMKMRAGVEALFEKHGVELYLTGHVHNYERTFPIDNNTAASTDPAVAYVDAGHTTHVVVGMAGDNEGLTDGFMAAPPSWSAVRHAELGWARLTVGSDGAGAAADETLKFEYVLSSSGKIFDTFTLRKTAAAQSR
jgi:hypothetical protein